jgi:protein NrfD
MTTTEKILWGLGGVAFLGGAMGLIQRVQTGHTLAGYGSYVPWGLWVGLYTLLVGMSAGAFLLASVSLGLGLKRLEGVARPALLIALATFLGGMLAIWLDLGHPLRAGRLFFATHFTSMMGWMAWFNAAYILVLLLLLWQVAWVGQRGTRVVRALGLFLVVAFSGTEGALFGVVGARGFWHSGLTPIKFLTEAALSGVALVTFFAILLRLINEELVGVMGRIVLGLLLAAVLVEFAEISIGYYAAIPAFASSLVLVFSGPFWWVFWFVHLGGGVVAPLVLLLLAGRHRSGLALATSLIAITALSTKLNLVIVAQAVPEFEELRMAYTGPGLTFDYFPTPVEFLTGVWIVGVVALLALAGQRLLPRRLETDPAKENA